MRLTVGVAVPKKAHSNTILVFVLVINWLYSDKAMARIVVGVYQVLNDIHLAHNAALSQICLYLSLNGEIESLLSSSVLLAITGKVRDIMKLHPGLEV